MTRTPSTSKNGKKNQGSSNLDSLQALGYYKIMNKKYWLLDYFTRPNNELSKYYIKKVEKFLKCLKKKQVKLPAA
jgi:hypothetical protein